MLHLAARRGEAVSTARIAESTSIPARYLAKVMRDLVVAGLISSARGPGGGFVLARNPAAVTLLEIVNAVEPIARIRQCPRRDPCPGGLCALHRRLDEVIAQVEHAFRMTTLADLLPAESRPETPRHKPRDAG